jgi:hypothetical protein
VNIQDYCEKISAKGFRPLKEPAVKPRRRYAPRYAKPQSALTVGFRCTCAECNTRRSPPR